MSRSNGNEDRAKQDIDRKEDQVLSGSLMNSNTGSGRTTRYYIDCTLVGRGHGAIQSVFEPLHVSTFSGDDLIKYQFHDFANLGIGANFLSTDPEGAVDPLSANTFAVNPAANHGHSSLAESGLEWDFSSAAQVGRLDSLTEVIGDAAAHDRQAHEPWNIGWNMNMASPMGNGMGMSMFAPLDKSINMDFDDLSDGPLSPTLGLSGLEPGQYYNHHQQFPSMEMPSLMNDHLVQNYQALPTPGYFQEPASPFNPSVPVVPTPVVAAPTTQGQFACTQLGCYLTFVRDTDRVRHESSVHGIGRPLYLCQVPGCTKSIGSGYTRKDKLTEHMWKKHGNLGHVKRT